MNFSLNINSLIRILLRPHNCSNFYFYLHQRLNSLQIHLCNCKKIEEKINKFRKESEMQKKREEIYLCEQAL